MADDAPFHTPLIHTGLTTDAETITGPSRAPKQMLADQLYDGHASVHDGETADKLGLVGAPIEGPTHFSQFDPLAYHLWGQRWFETGCISSHFQTMVIEGESVTAALTRTGEETATIEAHKSDGTPVLTGTATVDPDAPTELSARLDAAITRGPGELFIVDRLSVGDTVVVDTAQQIDAVTPNGDLYPFSLERKLAAITEPSPWYSSGDNPWGRPIVPFEMLSVLTNKTQVGFPVRGPAVGLFIDLEVRMVAGPVFVGEYYTITKRVLALSQSKRVESHWIESRVEDTDGRHVATVLLHSGVFKASYADYPADRL